MNGGRAAGSIALACREWSDRFGIVPSWETQAHAGAEICGGGVIGASIAYFLSCRGVKPIVIERTGLACAASAKSLDPPGSSEEGPMRS
jgi:hypothetical protein